MLPALYGARKILLLTWHVIIVTAKIARNSNFALSLKHPLSLYKPYLNTFSPQKNKYVRKIYLSLFNEYNDLNPYKHSSEIFQTSAVEQIESNRE